MLFLLLGKSGGAFSLTVNTSAVTLTGTSVALRRALRLSVSTAAVTVTGSTVSLKAAYRLAVTTAAVTLTGSTVAMAAARKLAVNTSAVTLTGSSVALKADRRLAVNTSAVTLTGSSVTLSYTAVSPSITVDSAAITLTGSNVALQLARKISVQSAAITLTGSSVSLEYTPTATTAQPQPGGGYYRPPILVGGTKKRLPEAEPPLEISEEDLAAYLAALQAPGLAQARMQAALDEVKARILAEAQALEFQAAAAQALEAIVADEEENDLLLLAA